MVQRIRSSNPILQSLDIDSKRASIPDKTTGEPGVPRESGGRVDDDDDVSDDGDHAGGEEEDDVGAPRRVPPHGEGAQHAGDHDDDARPEAGRRPGVGRLEVERDGAERHQAASRGDLQRRQRVRDPPGVQHAGQVVGRGLGRGR